MGKRNPIGAEEIYVQGKRAINDLVRVVWALRDQRAQDEYEDDRDQDAFDAVDDACLITAQLCAMWDRLWASVGQGRPDTIAWVRREWEQLDENHDHWLERQQRSQAAADLRRAIEEQGFDEESTELGDDSDELEVAEPLDERELGSDGADSESVA